MNNETFEIRLANSKTSVGKKMSAAEEAKIIRRYAKGRFTRKRNELLKSIADKRNREIESNYSQLVEAWALLESKHDLYAMYLTDEKVETKLPITG